MPRGKENAGVGEGEGYRKNVEEETGRMQEMNNGRQVMQWAGRL